MVRKEGAARDGSAGLARGDVIIYQRTRRWKGGARQRRAGGEASTTRRNPEYSSNRPPMPADERRNFDRLSPAFRGQSFAQVKLFGRAPGTRIMDPNRRLLSSWPNFPRFNPPTSLRNRGFVTVRFPSLWFTFEPVSPFNNNQTF